VDTASKSQAIADFLAFNPLSPKDWLGLFGPFALFGVWAILFAETGLLAGFFLPGDSLLFLAGGAASAVATEIGVSRIPLAGLLIGGPIFAALGAQTGHWLGARYGRRLFNKPDSRFFKQEYADKAEHYFTKFGPAKAIILARFIPIVRTFLNPVAGMLGVPARTFLLYNVIGAVLWVDGLVLVGYALAKKIVDTIGAANVDKYIIPVVLVIVLISMIPIFVEAYRARRARKRETAERA